MHLMNFSISIYLQNSSKLSSDFVRKGNHFDESLMSCERNIPSVVLYNMTYTGV